jgi:hypothetical protein
MVKKTTRTKAVKRGRRQSESKPVRLEMLLEDYDRLARCAKRMGLSLASYARMSVLAQIRKDEEEGS